MQPTRHVHKAEKASVATSDAHSARREKGDYKLWKEHARTTRTHARAACPALYKRRDTIVSRLTRRAANTYAPSLPYLYSWAEGRKARGNAWKGGETTALYRQALIYHGARIAENALRA